MRSALLLTLLSCAAAAAARIAILLTGMAGLPAVVLEGGAALAAFGVCAYLGLCVLDGDQKKAVPMAQLSCAQVFWAAVLGALAVAPVTLLCDAADAIIGAAQPAAEAGAMRAGAQFLPLVFKSALLVPVVEELFFRGYLLGALRRYGTAAAVLVSSLCFALVHAGGQGIMMQLCYALLGALFALGMIRTGGIAAAMIMHGCYNLTLILLSYAGLSGLFSGLSLISCVLRLSLCAAFAGALRRLCLSLPVQEVSAAPDEPFTRREKALVVAACAAVLLAAVLMLLLGV